ncbi:hypothetical protein [Sphingobacterium hotanense]|uniref:hypothetical protein n=1 Tax=Sphingobacterium hotanense TaxID=649196 RepID=UPI0021A917D8|nr:hypothetical protein [Sphingobacterium hotanense]MCT1526450.1 hypothetical protein [Sphingobacterium hotanense]
MIKASALHLVLVISLVVSIILGSLIYLHYFFRIQQQRFDRWHELENELDATTSLLLSNYFNYTLSDSSIRSPTTMRDSVRVKKQTWGMLDLITINASRQDDSLNRAFFAGNTPIDSTALYIVDEERSVSISGETDIKGDAFIPKLGINPAFVDGEYYKGVKELVDGKKFESTSSLPTIERVHIEQVHQLLDQIPPENDYRLKPSSGLANSFYNEPWKLRVNETLKVTQDSVIGNIILVSDSTLTISSTCKWEHAILIAKTIKIEEGFKGKGQFFALDSLIVENNVQLAYPSVLGLVDTKENNINRKLSIGENCAIRGLIFLHRENIETQMDILEVGKNSTIEGEVISCGLFKYTDPLEIRGSLYCYRMITQRPSSLYENYLINLKLKHTNQSPYFVKPHFWEIGDTRKLAIIAWLK